MVRLAPPSLQSSYHYVSGLKLDDPRCCLTSSHVVLLGGTWISIGSIALHDAGVEFLRACDASPFLEDELNTNAVCHNTRFVVIFSFLTSLIRE